MQEKSFRKNRSRAKYTHTLHSCGIARDNDGSRLIWPFSLPLCVTSDRNFLVFRLFSVQIFELFAPRGNTTTTTLLLFNSREHVVYSSECYYKFVALRRRNRIFPLSFSTRVGGDRNFRECCPWRANELLCAPGYLLSSKLLARVLKCVCVPLCAWRTYCALHTCLDVYHAHAKIHEGPHTDLAAYISAFVNACACVYTSLQICPWASV